jgi:hypothetical protein
VSTLASKISVAKANRLNNNIISIKKARAKLKGAKGDTGIQGKAGLQGTAGLRGIQGKEGTEGKKGSAGAGSIWLQ